MTFSFSEKKWKENIKINTTLIIVFMLTKILITLPILLFGTLSNKKEFLRILTPELDKPRIIEIVNNDIKDLLLIITKIDRLVKIISKELFNICLLPLRYLLQKTENNTIKRQLNISRRVLSSCDWTDGRSKKRDNIKVKFFNLNSFSNKSVAKYRRINKKRLEKPTKYNSLSKPMTKNGMKLAARYRG